MYLPQKQPMRAHVKKEHLMSIREKLDDLFVAVGYDMIERNQNRLLKALAVFILQGGTNAQEDMFADE